MCKQWKNERPDWCPRPRECEHLIRSQDAVCAGRLPEPVPHEDDVDTHRLCLKIDREEKPFATVVWNKSDAFNLRRVCDAIVGDYE